jgi:hypothetical protein
VGGKWVIATKLIPQSSSARGVKQFFYLKKNSYFFFLDKKYYVFSKEKYSSRNSYFMMN